MFKAYNNFMEALMSLGAKEREQILSLWDHMHDNPTRLSSWEIGFIWNMYHHHYQEDRGLSLKQQVSLEDLYNRRIRKSRPPLVDYSAINFPFAPPRSPVFDLNAIRTMKVIKYDAITGHLTLQILT